MMLRFRHKKRHFYYYSPEHNQINRNDIGDEDERELQWMQQSYYNGAPYEHVGILFLWNKSIHWSRIEDICQQNDYFDPSLEDAIMAAGSKYGKLMSVRQ